MARNGNDRQLAQNWTQQSGRSTPDHRRLQLCVVETGFTFMLSQEQLQPPEGTEHKVWTEGFQFLARNLGT